MKKNKLRVGLLLNGYNISAWSFKMIEIITKSDYADIVLVIINNKKSELNKTIVLKLRNNFSRIPYILIRKTLNFLYEKLIERNTYLPDANKEVNSEALLTNTLTIKVKTIRKEWSDYFYKDDILRIKEQNIDILVRCGFGILRGDILNSAKYGIWSFHHGDNYINRGGPPGFWESMESWPETGSILQILTEDLDNGKVLCRSFACTNFMSVTDNRSNYFWKSLSFMTRKMRELYSAGEDEFFKKVEYNNRHPIFYSERLYVNPTNYELAKLIVRKIKEKISILYDNKFYLNQWILMFHLKNGFSSSLWRYKKIIPPKDKFWADPHVIFRNDKYYIFIEEYMYKSQKGHIALITMDEDGVYHKPETVIDRPYHLSYPFVFEYENKYYMIPESKSNKTIELYKCVEFPQKWEFQMNLMDNVRAVDATVFYHKNKWWMFTNICENEGASLWDELFLFSANNLFTNNWQSHPLNPIVSDCKTSRPAGKIFSINGILYRPSQNCSTRYGYGFNISEITSLDENNYAEVLVSSVKPNWDKNIIGTHTFNRVNSLHIIDAIYKRRK
ncbi:MAG: hypothetical protein ABIC04_05345 [Nanoarchaeota archaeon]